MNKLQQRLFEEFDRFEKFSQYVSKEDAARIASRIVLEVAEESWNEGVKSSEDTYWSANGKAFEDFKKELLG